MARRPPRFRPAGVLPLPPGPPRIVHRPEVERCLQAVRRTRHRRGLGEGLLALAALACGGTVLLFGLDNALRLQATARTVLLAAFGLSLLAVLLREVLVRPFRPLSDEACALLYEEAHPELENRLINTVLFDRGEFRGLEAQAVGEVRREALAAVAGGPRRRIGSLRRAARVGTAALAALLALAAYRLLLPDHFANALARFARPASFVAPLAHTALSVAPGHAVVRPLEPLRVTAEVSGRLPESAHLHLSFGAAPAMRFDGRAFVFEVEGRTADYRYRVEAGDGTSEEFTVRVRKLPAVESLELAVHPPPYTGLPPQTGPAATETRVVRGSSIEFRARVSPRGARGALVFRDGESLEMTRSGDRLAAVWTAERDAAYDFRLEDEEGEPSAPPSFARSVVALADLPPSVEVVRPGRDLALPPGEGLAVVVRAEDDVGLAEASLELQLTRETQPGGAGTEAAAAWKPAVSFEGLRGQRSASPSAFLDPRRLGARPGDTLAIRARAVDLKGQAAASRPYRIRLLDPASAASREREVLSRARPGAGEILRRERALREQTASSRDAEAPQGRQVVLRGEQEAIVAAGREVLAAWEEGIEGSARRALARALVEPMPRAARALDLAGLEPSAAGRRPHLDAALREEDEAIALLEGALARLDAALEALARGELPRPEEDRGNRLRGDPKEMRELLERLEKFVEEERKVIEATEGLRGKSPDDFTAEEKEKLEALAASQERWGKTFADAKDDLSKVSPQDLSVGAQVKELTEVIEEVDLARDYLEAKDVELAVPVEQGGLELAEKLETNIERWLSRSRDNLKWDMEEPTAEFDVPLSDLPAEMQDIVGDLIDREEAMTPDTEDVTSSWLDSMDAGVGWDAVDGPISDMSAKGVTGNLLPNDTEIGGRSGEGRSGRSDGQFVEEEAAGKGGRPTPSRSGADAFESGEVKDSSRDPLGGATGGGKLAGAAAEGLRGAPSPELGRKMGALAEAQARVRAEAERLDHALSRRRYFSQDLARALDLLARMEKDLRAGRPYRYTQRQREIVSGLRGLQTVLASGLEHELESPPTLPKDLREELLNSGGEEMPREFRDAIRDYYRGLAGGSGSTAGDPGKGGDRSPPGSPAPPGAAGR